MVSRSIHLNFFLSPQFTLAVAFTLALAMGVNSSVIPLVGEVAGHGLSYTAVSRPATVVVAAPHAAVDVHGWGVHAPWGVHGAHWPVLAPGPVVSAHTSTVVHDVAVPAAVPVHVPHVAPAVVVAAPAHEGTYVAKTRGAVHTAPLSGHVQSVASVNVAAAPGTV